MSSNRDLKETIATEAERSGLKVEFGRGGKHDFAVLSDGKTTRRQIFASTPSDVNAVNNVRATTRRLIRGMQRVPDLPVASIGVREPVRPIYTPPVYVQDAPPLAPIDSGEMLYHFTTSCPLPRILADELLTVPTYLGVRDFLWATSNGDNERTSTDQFYKDPSCNGRVQRVRIGMHKENFRPWREVVDATPGWTLKMIESLESVARRKNENPRGWYVRTEPLPLDRVIGIDTRATFREPWKPFDPDHAFVFNDPENEDPKSEDGEFMAVEIGDHVYASTRRILNGGFTQPGLWTAYEPHEPKHIDEVLGCDL